MSERLRSEIENFIGTLDNFDFEIPNDDCSPFIHPNDRKLIDLEEI